MGSFSVSGLGASQIADGAITDAKIAAAAGIQFSKLEALTSGNTLIGSAGNVATSTTLSGDVTVDSSGVTAIGNNKVTFDMLSASLESGAWESVEQGRLSSDTPSIDITSISSNFKWFRIILSAIDDQVATQQIRIRFNNDSGSNYLYVSTSFTSAATTNGGASTTSGIIGESGHTSAGTDYYGFVDCYIQNRFTDITRWQWSAVSSELAVAGRNLYTSGEWSGTGPISRITLYPASGNFKTGTYYQILGKRLQ